MRILVVNEAPGAPNEPDDRALVIFFIRIFQTQELFLLSILQSDGVPIVTDEGSEGDSCHYRANVESIVLVFNEIALIDVESASWQVPQTTLIPLILLLNVTKKGQFLGARASLCDWDDPVALAHMPWRAFELFVENNYCRVLKQDLLWELISLNSESTLLVIREPALRDGHWALPVLIYPATMRIVQ